MLPIALVEADDRQRALISAIPHRSLDP